MKKEEIEHLFVKYYPLVMRLFVFGSVVFLIVPLLMGFLSRSAANIVRLNLFSMVGYVLAILVFFVVLKRKFLKEYKFVWKWKEVVVFSLVSLFFFWLYYYLSFVVDRLVTLNLLLVVFIAYFLGAIFLAVALFGLDFFKQIWRSIVIIFTLVYIYFMLSQFAWAKWHFFSANITRLSYTVLSLFFDGASYSVTGGDPRLSLNGFSTIIGAPCSGIESLSLFVGLFTLLVVYDWGLLDGKRTAAVFFIGLIGVYFLNVLRIALLMMIGTKYPEFAMGLFHGQAGWIFFSIFILGLLYFGYKWMRIKQ